MTKAQARKKISGAKKKVEASLRKLYSVTTECANAGARLATSGSSKAGAALGSWNYSVEPYKGAACKLNAARRSAAKRGKLVKGTARLSKAKRVARAKKAARARWGK